MVKKNSRMEQGMYDNVFESKWVSSRSALKLFAKAINDSKKARYLLSKALKKGEIQARCSAFVNEYDFGPVSDKPGKSSNSPKRAVKKTAAGNVHGLALGFWKLDRKSLHQTVMWQFKKGIFAVALEPISPMTITDDGRAIVEVNQRLVAYGVTFNTKDLIKVFEYNHELVKKPSHLKKAQPKKGRGSWNWAAAFSDLEGYAQDKKFPKEFGSPADRGFQTAIENAVADKLFEIHDGQASESAIRARAVDFLKRHDYYNHR